MTVFVLGLLVLGCGVPLYFALRTKPAPGSRRRSRSALSFWRQVPRATEHLRRPGQQAADRNMRRWAGLEDE